MSYDHALTAFQRSLELGHVYAKRPRQAPNGIEPGRPLRILAWNIGRGFAPQRIADTIRDVTKLRGEVELCAPGSLANDGKLIEDTRRFD